LRGRDGWGYVCRPVTCLHHRFASKGVLPLIQEHGSVFHWGAQIHLVLRSHRAHRWREHKELASEHKSETNPPPSCINIHEMRSFFSFFHCCFCLTPSAFLRVLAFGFFRDPRRCGAMAAAVTMCPDLYFPLRICRAYGTANHPACLPRCSLACTLSILSAQLDAQPMHPPSTDALAPRERTLQGLLGARMSCLGDKTATGVCVAARWSCHS
jgi:hypothetical protein